MGMPWLEVYMKKIRSTGRYVLSMNVAGKSWAIEIKVVNASVPLLMLRETMKKMKMIINLEEDLVIVGKEKINLRVTESGSRQ